MKAYWSKATILGSGFLLAMLMHLFVQCESYMGDYGDDPWIEPIELDIKGMEEGAKQAEAAFLSGDPDQVIDILSEDSKSFFGEQVKNIDPSVLKALGEAMKIREHTVKSSTYTEFEFKDQGSTYSVAFTLVAENSWKLVRF
ncbi:MAG: hypothetical protein KAH17_05265 [Bacteroidales bacterium]|nr:hypothetical protein [Bacteroidales bacterium]